MTVNLDALANNLTAALDPAARTAAIDAALEPFGPNGQWRYAPQEERDRVRQRVKTEQDEAAGEYLFLLEHSARLIEMEIEPLEAAAMEPPDPETAHSQRARKIGIGFGDAIQLHVLDELRQQRYTRAYASALPSQIRAAYVVALKDATEQERASLIRYVERLHGNGWKGADLDGNIEEAMALSKLKEDIAAARQARIPAELLEARAKVTKAYDDATRARARRVVSRRPADWKAAK